jgi:hypothetical protein
MMSLRASSATSLEEGLVLTVLGVLLFHGNRPGCSLCKEFSGYVML